MPSITSSSTVFPKIFVPHTPSGVSLSFLMYPARSSACFSFPTIGAISVSIFARIIWIDGASERIFTPNLLPCLIITGSSSRISSFDGLTTPYPFIFTSAKASLIRENSSRIADNSFITAISSYSP